MRLPRHWKRIATSALAVWALLALVHAYLGLLGARWMLLVETRLPPPKAPPPRLEAIGYVQRAACAPTNDSVSRDFVGILLVLSHAGSTTARDAMRAAYPPQVLDFFGLRRVFLLGTLQGDREPDHSYMSVAQSELRSEQELHQDIVQVELVEKYSSLSTKTLLGLRWARDFCPTSMRALVKLDEDALVDLVRLRALLDYVTPEAAHALGRLEHSQTDFLLGLLYVLTRAALPLLVSAAASTPLHRNEDIYVTGYVADRAAVQRIDLGGLISSDTDMRCCAGWTCARLAAQLQGHGVQGDHVRAQLKVAQHVAQCIVTGCWMQPTWLAALWPCR